MLTELLVDLKGECRKCPSKEMLDMDKIDVLIIGVNLKGKIDIGNQFAACTTDFPAEKALGLDLYSTLISVNKFDFKRNSKAVRQFLDTVIGAEPLGESNFMLLSSRTIEMSLKIIPWHKNSGELHGVILIGHGFREIKDNQDFRNSQELLAFVSCSAPLRGLDGGAPNLPSNMDGPTKNYISFLIHTPIMIECPKILVGEQDPSKGHAKSEGRDAWQDIQSFANSLDALIFGIDSSGKVNLWNDASVHLFGCPREDAIGKNFVQVPASWTTPSWSEAPDNASKGAEKKG